MTTIEDARRELAEVEADLREARDGMKQMRTAGYDHFQQRLQWAHQRGLQGEHLDAWGREAAGLAAVRR